jgi:hypothetical protein
VIVGTKEVVIKIEDGIGSGRLAAVNNRNRLDVAASIFTEHHLVAVKDAQTYIWNTSFSAATGNEVIYLKNTSKEKLLVIHRITVNSVNAGLFELYQATGTASGTSITGVNTNLTSGNAADAIAYGEAAVTGITLGNRIDIARTAANGRTAMKLDDVLVLGLNDAIAVEYTGSTGLVDLIITGYYDTLAGI